MLSIQETPHHQVVNKKLVDTLILTLQIHRGGEHRGPVDILNVRSSSHDGALRTWSTWMVDPHGPGARRRVVRTRHRGSRRRIPIRRLRHLAAGRQITVRARHVPQTRGVHAGPLEAAGIETSGRRLVQIRIIHSRREVHREII